jgi:hypothetical protein
MEPMLKQTLIFFLKKNLKLKKFFDYGAALGFKKGVKM